MVWHAENPSRKEGGDSLVRHPCDSKAWQHFEENVDPLLLMIHAMIILP